MWILKGFQQTDNSTTIFREETSLVFLPLNPFQVLASVWCLSKPDLLANQKTKEAILQSQKNRCLENVFAYVSAPAIMANGKRFCEMYNRTVVLQHMPFNLMAISISLSNWNGTETILVRYQIFHCIFLHSHKHYILSYTTLHCTLTRCLFQIM